VFSGCVSSRVAVTATVTAPVPINVTATPASLCPGQSSVLDVTSADPNYSYIWTPGGLVGPTHTVTPASTTAYTATGSNPINGCVTTATTTVAVNPAPSAITITPAAPIILPGATQQLEASGGTVGGNAVIGTGTIQNTSTSWPAPYGFYWNSSKHQMLILASELTAAGVSAGNINSLSFDVVSVGTCGPMPGFTMKMAHSAVAALTTTFETTGLSTVFGPVTYQPVVGINTHTFTAPFIWNGTSNIIVEVCFSNYPNGYTQNAVMNQTATTFASSSYVYSDGSDQCPNPTAGSTANQRPNMILGSAVPTTMTWAPFTALYTDTLTTIPYAGTSATKVFSKPTATITYTATATVPSSGCTTTQNVTVSLPVTCAMPTYTGSDTITSSSASIHWGEPQPAPGSGYEYEVRTSGAAGSGPNGLTLSGTTPLLRVHINGLAPGTTYHLYVRSNCGDNIYSGWTTDHQFTTGTLPLSITGVVTNLSCNQSMDGAINTTVTGGLPPYTFEWNTGETTQNISGLFTGTYFVIVTDANFATVSDSWNVLEPLEISWQGVATNVTCFGAMNGSITTIYTDGGTLPYTYTWSNGETTPNINGLAPGFYYLTVADAHNCDYRSGRFISEPAPLMLENPVIIPASCPTGNDGSIEVTVQGGTPPYSYLWTNGATTMNIFGLNPGEYGVVVTDANLCMVSNVYFVSQTSPICATIHVTGVLSETQCYNATGTITVAGSGTTFVVHSTGHATFIAGEKIFYKEGTTVHSGGYMLGKITSPTGPFCPVYAKMTEAVAGQEVVPAATERAFFNLYPNPTNGNFTLIQKGDRIYNNVKVEVYAMSGEKVLTESIIGLMKHEFRFNDMPSGLYFVRVVADDYVETIKLVKTR
ncbi:MAG: T9SS type A sorting domain-containing protein, partial [Bacteroidota bacterium]